MTASSSCFRPTCKIKEILSSWTFIFFLLYFPLVFNLLPSGYLFSVLLTLISPAASSRKAVFILQEPSLCSQSICVDKLVLRHSKCLSKLVQMNSGCHGPNFLTRVFEYWRERVTFFFPPSENVSCLFPLNSFLLFASNKMWLESSLCNSAANKLLNIDKE